MKKYFHLIWGIILILFGLLFWVIPYYALIGQVDFPNNFQGTYSWLCLIALCLIPPYFGIKQILKFRKSSKAQANVIDYKLSPQDGITVNTFISFNDYVQVNLYLIFSRFPKVLIIILVITGLSILSISNDPNMKFQLLPIFFIYPFVIGIFAYSIWKGYNGSKLLQYTSSYFLTSDSITFNNEISSGNITWAGILKMNQNKKFILLFTSAATCYILKKQDFKKEDLPLFEDFLHSRFPS